jgi:hypothetical protein
MEVRNESLIFFTILHLNGETENLFVFYRFKQAE